MPYVLRTGPAVQQRPDARWVRTAEVLARGYQPQIAIMDKDCASEASGQPVRQSLNLLDAHSSPSAMSVRNPDQIRYVLGSNAAGEGQAAVKHDELAGDPGGLVREQERDRVGDVLGRAEALEGICRLMPVLFTRKSRLPKLSTASPTVSA